ncbi:MAG: leucyl aminopeptidase [Actinomycetota bacterium]|nr:leucyl aminopeptidase [Actinomycetota bacterium]
MPITIELVRTVPEDAAATAVGVVSGAVDGAGVDGAFLAAQGFEAKAGEIRALPAGDGRTTFVVGLGPVAELTPDVLRRAAGNLARAAKRHPSLAVDLLASLPAEQDKGRAAAAVVEGLVLGGYQYTAFKSKPKPAELASVQLVAAGGKRVQDAVDRAVAITEAVTWARDLVNEPGGSLTPSELAKRVVAEAEGSGFTVSVWDEKEIRKERLGGVLGVNRGSSQPPRFLQLAYEPDKPRATVALVGKGITFDSGGLSLKTADGMVGMRGDMGGGAAVVGAMKAIAAVGAKVRVLGFVPLTDNMTGPDATRPGDVLTIRNGTTVEVLNTDAEGRLILADGLSLATEAAPDVIVDLATLTGACMVALGDRTAGLMANHRGFAEQVRAAADAAGEPVWPLPLPSYLRGKLDSDVADLKNITNGRFGGALSAGMFLQQFVGEGIPWVHLDIAGPSDASETDGEIVKGGTGFGVRTLVQLLSTFQKPKKSEA